MHREARLAFDSRDPAVRDALRRIARAHAMQHIRHKHLATMRCYLRRAELAERAATARLGL